MKKIDATFHDQSQSKAGLLCIADISGFTRFVRNTDLESGSSITQALMKAIIGSNTLAMLVSEIKGDAVFFCKFGTPPSADRILEQFEKMLGAFHQNLQKINQGRVIPFKLELKLIVHYGEISEYQLAGFHKLYGQSVVEVHRLLKGAVQHSQYALIMDDYVKNSGSELNPTSLHRQCKVLKALRKLCYTFFPYPEAYAFP